MTTSALGVLLGLIIASYVPYRVIPFIFLVPGLIYTGSILMCPESPQSLLMADKSQVRMTGVDVLLRLKLLQFVGSGAVFQVLQFREQSAGSADP